MLAALPPVVSGTVHEDFAHWGEPVKDALTSVKTAEAKTVTSVPVTGSADLTFFLELVLQLCTVYDSEARGLKLVAMSFAIYDLPLKAQQYVMRFVVQWKRAYFTCLTFLVSSR